MDVDITIRSDEWAADPDLGPLLERAARKTVEIAGLMTEPEAELSIVLAGDDLVRGLNRTYLGHDRTTNVLSFPQDSAVPGATARLLGDIALAYETVAREAAALNRPLQHHAAHLVVHGLLHLFGYDHDSDATATEMEDIERAVLRALAIPDPYADDEVPSEPAKTAPATSP